MITDIDVDDIVKEWLEEWRGSLQEPLPEHQNEEDPPVDHNEGHDNGQGKKGGDYQGNQLQEEEETTDDAGRNGSDHLDFECTHPQ